MLIHHFPHTPASLRSWTQEPFPILMLVAPSAPAKPPGNRSLVCSLLFLPVRIMQPEGCASSVKRALSSVGHVTCSMYINIFCSTPVELAVI